MDKMKNPFFLFSHFFNSFSTPIKRFNLFLKKSAFNIINSFCNYYLEDAYNYLTLKIKILFSLFLYKGIYIYIKDRKIFSFIARKKGASS